MTAASSMSAIKRRRPPQRGQASTSNPKVRRIRSAQRWPRALEPRKSEAPIADLLESSEAAIKKLGLTFVAVGR